VGNAGTKAPHTGRVPLHVAAEDLSGLRGNVTIDHVQAARIELARRASDHLPLIADLTVT
jgi:endonuclease/exonuclease/phosphatase family metal-dependent hydrolase